MTSMTEEQRTRMLAALREELRGYVMHGNAEDAKAVEKEIARLGGETPTKRAERRPATRGERRA